MCVPESHSETILWASRSYLSTEKVIQNTK